ncbi:NAD-dependent epimerase/dehydratase family protein [Herbiconiux sp. L3-i23]|uniref:NAD-dependent epimerase/dehydratase family protein n=1 Tax=Herbiconiux sp. L3-i23 TaxID=2905871 RepID=UPI002063F912|nr:NAD-dependent epimerase/dehydratase family protein [Herbiconiux sp. L3-i23]BDI23336.1 NAD-dependent epimerase [Herbiconiux sp. L3-i23]
MTTNPKHVVLGGTGVIGRETVSTLVAAGLDTVSVARNAGRADGAEHRSADLLDADATRRAVDGAGTVYLTAGLPYSARTWEREWPRVLANVIDASRRAGAHLVYFDNVYAYGPTSGPMVESTPLHPTSRKGRLRARLLETLADASADGSLVVTIARSADFYGPGASTSVFNGYVADRVAAGKDPIWLLDASMPHSMTYTPDAARALVTIGTDPRAAGRTWHVPTADPLTGADYMELATDGRSRGGTMSLATLRMGSLFVGAARESLELAYQQRGPYVFDSSAFESAFGVAPTPYDEGIAATIASARGESTVATR